MNQPSPTIAKSQPTIPNNQLGTLADPQLDPQELAEDAKVKAKEMSKHSSRTGWCGPQGPISWAPGYRWRFSWEIKEMCLGE